MRLDVRTINRLTEPFRLPKVTQAILMDKSKAIWNDYQTESQRIRDEKNKAAEKHPKVDEFNTFRAALKLVDDFTQRFKGSEWNCDLQASWQFQNIVKSAASRTGWRERVDFDTMEKDNEKHCAARNIKLNDFIVGLRQKMLADATTKAKALTASEQKALDAI